LQTTVEGKFEFILYIVLSGVLGILI